MGKSDTEITLNSASISKTPTTLAADAATVAEPKGKGWRNLWVQPVLLAILILVGLIGALAADGGWDLFFCLLLVWPVFKICHHCTKP